MFESLDQVREIGAQSMRKYNEERPQDTLEGVQPVMYRAQLEAGILLRKDIFHRGA